jgi:hypothetical protein
MNIGASTYYNLVKRILSLALTTCLNSCVVRVGVKLINVKMKLLVLKSLAFGVVFDLRR